MYSSQKTNLEILEEIKNRCTVSTRGLHWSRINCNQSVKPFTEACEQWKRKPRQLRNKNPIPSICQWKIWTLWCKMRFIPWYWCGKQYRDVGKTVSDQTQAQVLEPRVQWTSQIIVATKYHLVIDTAISMEIQETDYISISMKMIAITARHSTNNKWQPYTTNYNYASWPMIVEFYHPSSIWVQSGDMVIVQNKQEV